MDHQIGQQTRRMHIGRKTKARVTNQQTETPSYRVPSPRLEKLPTHGYWVDGSLSLGNRLALILVYTLIDEIVKTIYHTITCDRSNSEKKI